MQPIYVTKRLEAANTDGIAESQTPLAGGNLTLTASPVTLDTQRRVLFTFAADETGRTFVVYGTVEGGAAIQETVAGTATTAVTTQDFLTVTRITIDAASAGAIEVGTNGVGSSPWQIVNWHVSPINLGIACLVTGTVNFTWQYTLEDPSGNYPNGTALPTPFDLSALASKSADTASSVTTPLAAWRITVNSGTDPVTAVVLQSGIAG